uniref:S8 family serine peptidase n=1 Tax=Kineococcus sp. SYSU DK006 TaxID=3383127 RepID=UPI003D7D28C1
MPSPTRRPAVLGAGLLALALCCPASAQAVEVPTGTGAPVAVDALRWVDGVPQLTTRTAPGPAAAQRLEASLEADPAVSSAQVRTTYAIAPTSAAPLRGRTLLASADPYIGRAYHLQSVDAYGAWPTATGDGVTVAVLDSGVDPTQPDIAGRVTVGPNFASGTDIGTHGTQVSTVLAGAYQNGVGAAGVAPDVDVLAIRVCAPEGCASNWVVNGILAAVERGADVINLSLGGDEYNQVTADAVAYAIGKGVVVVASAGNSGDEGNPVEYPASYPGVVSVSASTSTGAAAAWAQHNAAVDLSAPGERIPAGDPRSSGGYLYYAVAGTSFSAPQVAGGAGGGGGGGPPPAGPAGEWKDWARAT